MTKGKVQSDGYIHGEIVATDRGIELNDYNGEICPKCGLPKEGEFVEMCNCEEFRESRLMLMQMIVDEKRKIERYKLRILKTEQRIVKLRERLKDLEAIDGIRS